MYKEKENTKISLCLAALLLETFPIKIHKLLCLAGRGLRKTLYLFADVPDSAWNVLSFATHQVTTSFSSPFSKALFHGAFPSAQVRINYFFLWALKAL